MVPYGAWHARELEHLMSYLGMSAMDAILAGTRNAAMTLPFGHEVGTLNLLGLAALAEVLHSAGTLEKLSLGDNCLPDRAVPLLPRVPPTPPLPLPPLHTQASLGPAGLSSAAPQ